MQQYYSCLVEDPTTDIVIIDPNSPSSGISDLTDLLCKSNGYDVRITEVNPEDGGYKTFIEILNFGASASVSACWDSTGDCSSSGTIDTGEYFVAYVSGDTGTTPTGDADATASDLSSESNGVCP